MKKIENMNFKEAKEAFSKWEAKHPRLDSFDMGGLVLVQCGEIARGTDREATATMLYDLFNYGFMAGYKQSEAELKAKEKAEREERQKVIDEDLRQYEQ